MMRLAGKTRPGTDGQLGKPIARDDVMKPTMGFLAATLLICTAFVGAAHLYHDFTRSNVIAWFMLSLNNAFASRYLWRRSKGLQASYFQFFSDSKLQGGGDQIDRLMVFMGVLFTALTIILPLWLVLGETTVMVTNSSNVDVAVRLESDIGESQALGNLDPGETAKATISGRDKALWVVAVYTDGKALQSNEIYMTRGVTASASITAELVEISPNL